VGLVPIYIYEKDSVLPEEGTYYVVAKNGTFLRKDKSVICGMTKVDGIQTLGDIEPYVSAKMPKIPGEIIFKALTFFKRVYNQYSAEAEVALLYNKTTEKFDLACRRQDVSGGRVNYSPKVNGQEDPVETAFFTEKRREGWPRVGTIHSHCVFSAFHSATDTGDETWQEGVHLTIGHVNKRHFSMVGTLVVGDQKSGTRYPADVENLVNDIEVRSDSGGSKYGYMYYTQPASYYDFTFSDDQIDDLLNAFLPEIIEDWMPKVFQTSYVSTYNTNYNNWQGRPPAPAPSLTGPYKPPEVVAQPVAVAPDTSGHPVEFLWQVRAAAHVLKNTVVNVTQERQDFFRGVLQKFFGKQEITTADLESAALVEPKKGG
jgi:hypothetical protein